MKGERGQGLRLERGSGGLGEKEKDWWWTEKPEESFSEEKKEEGHLLVDKHLACFW